MNTEQLEMTKQSILDNHTFEEMQELIYLLEETLEQNGHFKKCADCRSDLKEGTKEKGKYLFCPNEMCLNDTEVTQ